jgi:hypothetical protein
LAFGELTDPATIATIAAVIVAAVIIAAAVIILFMRRRMQQPKQPKKPADTTQPEPELAGMPFKIMKSVQTGDASHAKDELRILDLERDILSDAIRRLYEAQAEGKINEQERERLAGTYKARMGAVKDSIAKDETIVALHELEGMQEDLMKLFSERFGELSSKVEELRTRIDVKPLKEIKVQLPQAEKAQLEEEEETEEAEEAEGEEEKPKKRKKPEEKQSAKTEAEQRVDEIRSEVERVLDKLGQMEIES